MLPSSNVFGANLLSILKTKEISQSELAHKIGVSQSCLSRWITGQRALHAHQRKKICAVLGIDESNFFQVPKQDQHREAGLGPLF
jgi:transcriptional regulator with XRE-family HTH domain